MAMSPLTARIRGGRTLSATALRVVLSSQAPGIAAVTGRGPGTSPTTAAHTRETRAAQAVKRVAIRPGSEVRSVRESPTGRSGPAACQCGGRGAAMGKKAMARSSAQDMPPGKAATMARATATTRG
jgi:hypothetical protein